ncbi:hypothetical protein CTEN210_09094 [Chaetoceros tenuissimus]|uniref:Bromo domain-containing protein n=1 Tax=Chaetoceros tenuissimus TaxID=426638 RepID=A0AAD3CV98_9STRA|nr:hypothetical protein CTEN210_09094 [Chaetoceros tenuissimus]
MSTEAAAPQQQQQAELSNQYGIPVITKEEEELYYETMYRITDGLPAHELQLMNKEATECEAALQKEIELLEEYLKSDQINEAAQEPETPASSIPVIPPEYDSTNTTANHYLPTAQQILESELSPLDRYFTVSALIGRIREPLDTPPPPHSALNKIRLENIAQLEKKKNKQNQSVYLARITQSRDKYKKILELKKENPIYTQLQSDPTTMLALIKRISNHRTAAVFRRAVNPLEAPGYAERILFPMDLTLVKKLIACNHISTFEEMHQWIGLICHDCVKFNGRDSDYSILTREFESYVDDSFIDYMQKLGDKIGPVALAALKKEQEEKMKEKGGSSGSSGDSDADKKMGAEGNATDSAKDESSAATDAKMPATETVPAATSAK